MLKRQQLAVALSTSLVAATQSSERNRRAKCFFSTSYSADGPRRLRTGALAGRCVVPTKVRDAYFDLVQQGWTDALRHLYQGERIYTFWKYLRNAFARDAGLRIDHFQLSSPVAIRLVSAGVEREVRGWEHASDHAPVWIELSK